VAESAGELGAAHLGTAGQVAALGFLVGMLAIERFFLAPACAFLTLLRDL
jgi:hypothetical protein